MFSFLIKIKQKINKIFVADGIDKYERKNE